MIQFMVGLSQQLAAFLLITLVKNLLDYGRNINHLFTKIFIKIDILKHQGWLE